MPSYFLASSTPNTLPSLAAADALAATMNDAASALGVRIVAVKPKRPGAFVYAYSSPSGNVRNKIVDVLRRDSRLADLEISGEGESADGPFG